MLESFIDNIVKTLVKKEMLKKLEEEIIKKPNYYVTPEIIVKAPKLYSEYTVDYRERNLKKRKRRGFKTKGIRIPKIESTKLDNRGKIKFYLDLEVSSEKEINMYYPITRIREIDENVVFSYAWIHWSEKEKSLIYEVVEPKLPQEVWSNIERTLSIIKDTLDVPFDSVKNQKDLINYILDKTDSIWKTFKINIPEKYKKYAKYYIIRDTVGYGKIDPLMNDPYIEDISCNGVNIPIFIFHRNPYIGEIKTNIVFTSEEELDSFVMKLALRTGRFVSIAQPLLDAALPDGSRIQITYGKDISMRGSSFTIRKFTKDPFTPIDLINYGTIDFSLGAYLWTLIEEGKSILIAGGTATGKTSMLNAISLFIKPEKKVVSIEDTPELRLPHPNWLQEVARPGFGPQKYGEVSLVDLLKASLRQRPDYIIVGEVRGQETYVLFQAMATGHTGLGTIHAESFEGLVDRLISPPINLPPVLLELLDAVVFLKRVKIKNKYIRRVSSIYEIVGWNRKKNTLNRKKVFRWIPKNDEFESRDSIILREVMDFHGWDEQKLRSNLMFKSKILEYLWKNKVRDYLSVSKYIKMYYDNPKKLIEIIGGK